MCMSTVCYSSAVYAYFFNVLKPPTHPHPNSQITPTEREGTSSWVVSQHPRRCLQCREGGVADLKQVQGRSWTAVPLSAHTPNRAQRKRKMVTKVTASTMPVGEGGVGVRGGGVTLHRV